MQHEKELQKREWTEGISFKIIFSVLVPLFFMGSAFLLIFVFSITHWHLQTEKDSINRFMSGYSATLKNAFDLSDFDYIKNSMIAIGEMTEMLNFGLFDVRGKRVTLSIQKDPLFEKAAKDVGRTIQVSPKGETARTFKYKSRDDGTVLRNVTILHNKGSCVKCHSPEKAILGFIMADFSMRRINKQILIHVLQALLTAIVSIFVMIIVLKVVLKRMIQQPLEEITSSLHGISIISGDIKQIEHNSPDEIGVLVDAINGLAERHEYMQQEISSFYDGAYDPVSPLEYESEILSSADISEMIEKDIEVLYNDMQLKDVLSFMKESSHTFFPVINRWGGFEGVITLQNLRTVLMDPSMSSVMKSSDFLNADAPYLISGQDLKSTMDMFNNKKVPYISVIDRDTRLFLGIVARRKVLEILKKGFLKSVGI